MVKRVFLTISAAILCGLSASADVKINEISTSNLSAVMNRGNYNFSNYIEFDTQGDSVNLNDHLIIHYGKRAIKGKVEEKWRWRINSDIMVGPNDVIWMDESTLAGHAPYKLDADGGSIVIYHGSEKIDSFAYDAMDVNLSYGYKEGVLGYMAPTPGEENSAAYTNVATARSAAPLFSHKGGVLDEPIELTLEQIAEGATVYYTTDGSEPSSSNGKIYSGPIYIGSNANVRCIAYEADKLPSKVNTVSFLFVDEVHSQYGGFTLPIVSITVDSAYFYSDTVGICVIGTNGVRGEKNCTSTKANYNRDWKRPIHFEYFVNGEAVVSQLAEAHVEGGCSRTEKIKSLAVKTSKKTGVDTFGYHFFASKPNVTHRAIHIRNGGTAYNKVRFRDGLMQSLATDMNIDYQAYQPIAYYINGVYQGLMNLNERTNADYIEANHDIEEDKIDLITLSDQLGIRASVGTKDAYTNLTKHINQFWKMDPTEYYEGACARMDMDEYVDYNIFQQFIVNTDWPGNNTKIWREKDGGKFRWMLFDTDFGLGLPGYEYLGSFTKNMIKWCSGDGNTQWANNRSWMTEIFDGLKRNKMFERKFTTKYLIHLSTTFTQERITAVFDSITTLLNPEYQACFGKKASDAAGSMKKFALNRPVNIYKHLMSYVGGTDTTSLTIQSEMAAATLFMNGEKIQKFKGKYFKGYELEVIAQAPEGYEFAAWEFSTDTAFVASEDTSDSRIGIPNIWVGTMVAPGAITATFRPATATEEDSLPTIMINEISTNLNGLSQYPDARGEYTPWIEIYNYGEKNIDLTGYTFLLKRGDSIAKESTIPAGYGRMTIGPKEHKVFRAVGKNLIGPDYLQFKIGKDTLSTLCIARPDSALVDCIDLITTGMNESYGRESDGADEWVVFTTDPLEHNPSPGKKNGVKDTTGIINIQTESLCLQLYPNPTVDQVTIKSSETMEHLNIYDMTGRLLFKEEPMAKETQIDTDVWERGMYIVEIRTRKSLQTTRLIKCGN